MPSCLIWRALAVFFVYFFALSVPMLWAMDRNESPRIIKGFASASVDPALDIIQVRLSESAGRLDSRITLRGSPLGKRSLGYLLKLEQNSATQYWLYIERAEQGAVFLAEPLADGRLCAKKQLNESGAGIGIAQALRVEGIHIDFDLPIEAINYVEPLTYSAQSLDVDEGALVESCAEVLSLVDLAPHPRAPQKTIQPIALTNRLCDGRY